MKLTITPLNVVLTAGVIFLLWWSFIRKVDNSELDLYKKQYEKQLADTLASISKDSIKLSIQYQYELSKKDSTLKVAQKENYKRQQIINSYAIKIKNLKVVPISVIDHSLDSLFGTRQR